MAQRGLDRARAAAASRIQRLYGNSATLQLLRATGVRASGLAATAPLGSIQRWESESLKQEHSDQRYYQLRGWAIMCAHEDGEDDISGNDSDFDLIEFLPDAEQREFRHHIKVRALTAKGLTATVHHILSRDKISALYNRLSEQQKEKFGVFMRGGDKSLREALLSLRSNLAYGPLGAKRTDDPNRVRGGGDFDPNFAPDGQLDPISQVYQQADTFIGELLALSNEQVAQQAGPLINQVFDLFVQAEALHATRQGLQGQLGRTTIDVDNVESNWVGTRVGEPGESWRKTNRPN